MSVLENITDDTTVAKFRKKTSDAIRKMNTLSEWCIELYEVTSVKPPYDLVYGIYENMTCYGPHRAGEEAEIDVEATQIQLAKVIQFARIKRYAVDKGYSKTQFTVTITIPDGDKKYSVEYYASRQSVCKPKITKTVEVPATTREEVVEWDCAPVAFTKIDAGVEKPELNK